MQACVYAATGKNIIWDKKYRTKHWNMLCPYLHVNSVVEVPPGDHDVLQVTGIHPHRILMQASVKIAAAGLCLKGKKGTFPNVFDLSDLGFVLS